MVPLNVPKVMRACQGADYGDIDTVITVPDDVPVPYLDDVPQKKRADTMLIKTHAVSLAPGDCRVLSGITKKFQGPPSFPYIPGGDCSGIVVELPPDRTDLPFQVGAPRGALGEYALVSTKVADKIPDTLSFAQAAALVSATPSIVLADLIQEGERVLVLGARGGVGAHLCQLVKHVRKASLVVGVTQDPRSLLEPPIAIDAAVNYTTQDVYSMQEYIDKPFDTIVDLAGFGYARLQECVSQKKPLIVKTGKHGGRFITTVPPVGPIYEIDSIYQMVSVFILPLLWTTIVSRMFHRSTLPVYDFAMGLPETRDCVTRAFEYAKAGQLTAVMDPTGPFEFTTQGVRSAFHLQKSQHAKGKVVIRIAKD
jgi:NADPH:quinone reductase-like Zn-dependent oxidoreductase